MQPSFKNIHRQAFNRILITTLGLAALLGIASYLFDLETLDERVVALAQREVAAAQFVIDALEQGKNLDLSEKQGLLKNFDLVELYDRSEHKLLEVTTALGEEIEAYLDTLPPHHFPKDGKPYYERIELPSGQTVWQVLLPVFEQGRLIGFLEGVYHPSDEDLALIYEQVAFFVLMVVVAVLLTAAVLYPIIMRLVRAVEEKSKAVLKGNVELMEVMGEAIAKRDSDTDIHNYRVTLYALELAKALGVDEKTQRKIAAGAFLHDVGKIAIPDHILLKPGKLTDEEFEIMKTHVSHGADILKRVSWLEDARDIPLYHHEKYDGTGYLSGLKGEQIPFMARLFAVVDVFDALTSARPYKKPMPVEKALEILQKDAGTHFDPEMVAVFAQHAPQWYQSIYHAPDEQVRSRLRAWVLRLFEAAHA